MMPKINRARVVNIQYDGAKKAYQDQVFDFRGENGIILLENGGGKTLLVQLLLQVIKPNTPMNKRLFRELFSSGQTSHLMIEWLSDGQQTEYVLTGLTAMMPRNSESLSLFNFIHQYTAPNPFDLGRIPVVRNRRVTPRRKFREILKSADRDIRIYDTRKRYWKDLATYNILHNEWEAIRRVNDEEGRAEGFFDAATTVSRLFRNILIPAAVGVLYPEDSSEEVMQAFTELRKKLVNIPRYQAELEELESLRRVIESIRDEIVEYGRISQLYRENLTDIGRLSRFLQDKIPAREKTLAQLQKKGESIGAKKKDLKFHLACLEVDEKRLELEEIEQEIREMESEAQQVSEFQKQLQDRKNFLQACALKQSMLKKEKERAEARAQLAAENSKMEDLEDELRLLRRAQVKLLPGEIGQAQQAVDEMKKRLETTRFQQEEMGEERREIRRKIANLQQKRGALDDRIKRADCRGNRVEERLGWKARVNPEAQLGEKKQQLQGVEEKLRSKKQAASRLRGEINQLTEHRAKVRHHISVAKDKRARAKERVQAWEQKRADLVAELMPYVGEQHSLDVLHSAPLAISLQGEKEQMERRLEEATVTYHESRGSLSRMESEAGYVPNGDMINVRDCLKELGISAVFGGEFIHGQKMQQSEQLAALRRHPLLPYGLVITDHALDVLRRDATAMTELSLDAPVPLFTNREMLLMGAGESGDLVSIEDGYLYITANRSFGLHISEKQRCQHRDRLDSAVQDAEEQMRLMRNNIRKLDIVGSRLDAFQHEYRADSGSVLRDRLQQAIDKLEYFKESLRKTGCSIRNRGETERRVSSHIEGLQGEIQRLREEMADLSGYLDLWREGRASRESKKEVEQALKAEEMNLQQIEDSMEALGETRRQVQSDLEMRETDLVQLQRILSELKARDPGVGDCPPGSYQEIVQQVEALEKKMGGMKADGLRRLVDNLTETIDRYSARIRQMGFEPADIESRSVSNAVIEELKQKIDNRAEVLACKSERISNLSNDKTRMCGAIGEKRKSIEQQYRRIPPCSISVREVSEERLRLREALREATLCHDRVQKGVEECADLIDRWTETAKRARSVLQQAGLEEFSHLEPLAKLTEDAGDYLSDLQRKERELFTARQEQKSRVSDAYTDARTGGEYRYQMTRKVLETFRRLSEDRLYDPDKMLPQFNEFFELLQQHRAVVEENLRILEEDRSELERKALREGERLYEELNQIQRYSRFDLRDSRRYTVQIDLRAVGYKDRALQMQRHIDRAVKRLAELEDSDVQEFIRDRFSPVALLDAVAPIERYQVKILKPESHSEGVTYVAWESVPKWSGGEKFTAYFIMLVTLLSYLRDKQVPEYSSSKVLIADNPFGRASSPHLLEVVFGLARETDTQMICLTGLRDRAIYDYFPIVYSLKLLWAQGRQHVKVDTEESQLREDAAVISSAQYGLFDGEDEANE